MTNRKSHTRFRLVPKSTTAHNLDGPLCTTLQNTCQFCLKFLICELDAKLTRTDKVVDFDTNRKRVCDFLLVINSNLGRILPRF